MKTYLVGGAVRDKLLNLPVKDHDWVVVGTTPEEMTRKGFQPVGQDFPVFLHPKTKEEYALARTERKSGHGYAGFTFHTSPDVTLEEDLIRRDLTINAMAEDESGKIVDPYGGLDDLNSKVLRHVSPAFQEDPLRILRVARFMARFKSQGFTIASETLELMQTMVNSGEASHLVAERVWQETERALLEPNPEAYFETLEQCGALKAVMPEWTPFLNDPVCLAALHQAANSKATGLVRFACLFHYQDGVSQKEIKAFFKRMRFPSQYSEMATLVFQHESNLINQLTPMAAESIMTLFENTDAFRRPERFAEFLESCLFLAQVKQLKLDKSVIQKVIKWLKDCQTISAREIVQQGFKGREVGDQLRLARIAHLSEQLGND